MGLLEKALEFKKEINSKGRSTLIDRIQGPAETEFLDKSFVSDADGEEPRMKNSHESHEIDDDLFQLPSEDQTASSRDILKHSRVRDEEINSGTRAPEMAEREKPLKEPYSNDEELNLLGAEDEPDLSRVREELKQMREDEIIDTELDITIIEDGENDTDTGLNRQNAAGTSEETARDETESGLEIPGIDSPDEDQMQSRIARRVANDTGHNKKPHDFMMLFEICREIINANSLREIYDIIIFSVMGQIGVSSTTLLFSGEAENTLWSIVDSRGINLRDSNIEYDPESGILGQLCKKKSIIDMEDFKGIPEYHDEYFKLISIDARLLCPIGTAGTVHGAMILGEKISIGDYSDAEKSFLLSVAEIAAMAIEKVGAIESLQKSLGRNEKKSVFIDATDELVEKISGSGDIDGIDSVITEYLAKMGIHSFAFYVLDNNNEEFFPDLVDGRDSLKIKEGDVRISRKSPFIEMLANSLDGINIEECRKHDSVRSAFPDISVIRMQMIIAYPVKSAGELIGFLSIFALDDHGKMTGSVELTKRASRALVTALFLRRRLSHPAQKYNDTIDSAFHRIIAALENSKALNIPFTLVVFSIKNFKRYLSQYGHEEGMMLLHNMKKIIVSRLADTDFAVRLDRHKVLVALPGKNKKYAIPMANAIRNELVQNFRKKEMQLMFVYIAAEYPEDGDDIHSLLHDID